MEPTTTFTDEKGLSAWIGVAQKTLGAWRRQGVGPQWVRLGHGPRGPVRYSVEGVKAWLADRAAASGGK